MSTTKASGALHDITPYLMYRDAAGGIAICRAAFGAAEAMAHTEGERIAHAQLRIGDSLHDPVADRDHGRSGSIRDPYGDHWHITSQPRGGAGA